MNRTRERIDLRSVKRVYGTIHKVKVSDLFYESRHGSAGPEGWEKLSRPIDLETAAATLATRYILIVTTESRVETYPEYRRDEVIRPRFNLDKPRTYMAGRLRLAFTSDRDTPVMVAYRYGNKKDETAYATWGCVNGENAVDGYELNDDQMTWLGQFEDEVESWFRKQENTQLKESY